MFRRLPDRADEAVVFTFDGRSVTARPGDTVAVALLAAGITACRHTPVSGAPRGPFCMMGVCFECLVTVDGRKKLAIGGKISQYIPNPTFERVAAPGAHLEFYRARNPEGRSLREIQGKAISPPDEFRRGEKRLAVMDRHGVHAALFFPTLFSAIENRMSYDHGLLHDRVVAGVHDPGREARPFAGVDHLSATSLAGGDPERVAMIGERLSSSLAHQVHRIVEEVGAADAGWQRVVVAEDDGHVDPPLSQLVQ